MNNLDPIIPQLKPQEESNLEKSKFEKISNQEKGSGKTRRSATPGKWKENFTEEEKILMGEILGKTLKELGYDN